MNEETEQKILNLISSNVSGVTIESLEDSVDRVLSLENPLSKSDLTIILNSLVESQAIQIMSLPGAKLVFKARSKEDATLFQSLSDDERVIFGFIKECGSNAAWIKHIKEKSGLHTKVVTDVISKLEKRKLIKKINNVKQPTKKLYMLSSLEPSADLTGGSWYTDNTLDVSFIDSMTEFILKYIQKHTSHAYADTTVPDIHQWIVERRISSQPLSVDDVGLLVQRLVYDGLIYCVDGEDWYRPSSKASAQSLVEVARAFAESPCGGCPVFDICRKDGVVSPQTCEYLDQWLHIDE